jgi:hypothetical protein
MITIQIKILGYKHSQRYSIVRVLTQARSTFEKQHPEFKLEVEEITTAREMLAYTPVIAFPSLMIAGKLVCVGRFPSRQEVLAWLEQEAHRELAAS